MATRPPRPGENSSIFVLLLPNRFSALWALTDALGLLVGAIAAGIGTVVAASLSDD